MIKDILTEVKKSCFSVLPIYLLIMILCITPLISLTGYEILCFSIATILLIIGISLFNYGAEHAMTPIGEKIGRGLTKQGKVYVLLIVVFIFGFVITIAEPDLTVLAMQTESLFNGTLLKLLIGLGVGVFLLFGLLRIIHKVNLMSILSALYLVAFGIITIICLNDKNSLIAMSFDSGGVTTGPMTVPFLMALGAGVAKVLAKKSEKDSSFGFIAFSSIGPIVVMLILCLFSKGNSIEYALPNYELDSNFVVSYLGYVLEKAKGVGIAILLLFACYLIVDLLFLHSDKKKIKKLFIGLIIAYVGLVIFLAAVDCTYMGIGFKIGCFLKEAKLWAVVTIAFVIGALTVLAEPAIKILTTQVEEITNGTIKRRSMLIALSIGVGLAISLALLRIVLKFDLLYIIVPGYILCFVLSFFIPRVYSAIAFDAGGVASGPLTSSFILPIAIGLCFSYFGASSIPNFGFGIVSLVALSPLLSIEILGVISKFKKSREINNNIKKILKEEDKIIISFGD